MRLSEEQESFIAAEVDTHQLKIKTLKDDLFDHLCCAVEAKIQEGASFEEAFQGSLTELDPDGLFELEKETIFLINKNRIIMMKRIQYFIGFIGAFSLSVGATLNLCSGQVLRLCSPLAFCCYYAYSYPCTPQKNINTRRRKIN